MANRVILYDQTYDSETKKENRTQFNPVTDIESVFHSAKQVSNGSEPVGNNIFTANQESLLTVLSRINTWLYKLKALNNYEVARDKNARDNDLALQKTVNTQISQINEEISGDKTSIDLLQQKVQYLDDIIIDMAYNMDCINQLIGKMGRKAIDKREYLDAFGFPVVNFSKKLGFEFDNSRRIRKLYRSRCVFRIGDIGILF